MTTSSPPTRWPTTSWRAASPAASSPERAPQEPAQTWEGNRPEGPGALRDPARSAHVVGDFEPPRTCRHRVDHRQDRKAPRAVTVGREPHQPRPPHPEPELLAELAPQAALGRLAGLEEAARQIPRARVRRTCTPHEQHPVTALDESYRGRDRIVVERPPAGGTAAAEPALLAHTPQARGAQHAVTRRQQRGRRSRPSRIFVAMAENARAAGVAGSVTTKGSPRSLARLRPRSNGTSPRNGMPASAASFAASGPGKSPAMFSIRPRTGVFACWATVIDLRTTSCDTSDGIVTMTVPASTGTSEATVVRRSVPGGRSRTSASSSPQAVSARNSRSA